MPGHPPTPEATQSFPADRHGRQLRDLRISVTDRCNFRCPYCMPAEIYGEKYTFLPRSAVLSFEEIERLAKIFAGLGTSKLRITGGEPLLRAELPVLIKKLAAIEGIRDIALTSNGQLLAEQARPLRDAGLGRVTVSLDSLDPEIFRRMAGRSVGPERVLAGIEAADRAGLTPIKINCVVQRGRNDESFIELARRFRGTGHIVRFIEYMDVGTLNRWESSEVVAATEILDRISQEAALEPVGPAYPGEVARRYRYRDGSGEIGIIASVTQPFCGDCTRARLTPDGRLVTCLFATSGRDLKGALRGGASDFELRELIRSVWNQRNDAYSEQRGTAASRASTTPERRKVEMYEIGG
ncbi:MAG: GTP 3',8-cyclase MoaA [Myxococcota bacterium]|nr:GTP 3',8-cyclase MoaA [Myxococcota bacterium]